VFTVPGAPPRTSTAPSTLRPNRNTVTPVGPSVYSPVPICSIGQSNFKTLSPALSKGVRFCSAIAAVAMLLAINPAAANVRTGKMSRIAIQSSRKYDYTVYTYK
jgi:hypothetical protein